MADFSHPALLWGLRSGEPLRISGGIWHQKTRVVGLAESEEIMMLVFFVLTQYRHVTDGQTDGRTGDSIYAL